MLPLPGRTDGRRIAALALAAVVLGVGVWFLEHRGTTEKLAGQLIDQPICDPRFCGNNEPNPGEDCDDGNTRSGDGCDALCRIECTSDCECPSGECSGGICVSLCGNGKVDGSICAGASCPTPVAQRCSQAEECDDGALNGTPGKCTRRCTYCGNGVIDTVNGVKEACDDGAQNGEPGSSCSLQCTPATPTTGVTHTTCSNRQCVLVAGPGTNQCTSDTHCCDPADPTCKRLICTGVGACTEVQGPGMPLCASGTDCCDPADPTCQHNQCDFVGETCGVVPGPGMPQCAANNACTPFHFSCEGQQCAIQAGPGADSCTSALDCQPVVACNNDGQCSANESCQCLDCFDAVRCNACDNDAACEAGESCSCGDCSGAPSCQTHTACQGAQCVSVAGPGTNGCTNNAQCAPTVTEHLECVNHACTTVLGPGMDLCTPNTADCVDDIHTQCDFLFQTCENVDGAAADQCPGGDCGNLHLECSGNQCAVVAGGGPSTCGIGVNCGPLPTVCVNDGQCSATESCQCADCDTAARCNACNNDAVCSADESCLCDDCDDTPACIPHTECDPTDRQCIVVRGEGTNECYGAVDCAPSQHLECNNMACVLTPGPGRDLCTTSADCCDPADPTCVHAQCNPLTQSCITVAGPAPDDCSNDIDCTDFHSICSEKQCILVAGPGTSECMSSSECENMLCGNGAVEPGEQCDPDAPGALAARCNDQCELLCTMNPDCPSNVCDNGICVALCGNGQVDTSEDCDDGDANRTNPPSDLGTLYCTDVCIRPECDDLADNDHDQLPDALDAGCYEYNLTAARGQQNISSFLGQLLAQSTDILLPITPLRPLPGKNNELCPAGTVDRGSFCALMCEPGEICPTGDVCPEDGVCPVLCPSGAIDDGEECDDGNLIDTDACSNLCQLAACTGLDCPLCGDAIVQTEIGEQCDDGGSTATCTNNCRMRCDGDDDCEGVCDLSKGICLPPSCGDGKIDQAWERCDDGNTKNGDTCNNQCQPTCNTDADCSSGSCDVAKHVCVPLCGNGHLDGDEQCDDGNTVNNDSCSSQCQSRCTNDLQCDCDEEHGVCRNPCGNGRIDGTEQCDDGNSDDRDACTNSCRIHCVPGTVCPDSQTCPANGVCPVAAVCGDGTVQAPDEQCDDGNTNDTDGCSNSCTVRCSQNQECPSGLLCIGEQCAECTSSLQCTDGFCVDGRCRSALPICGNGTVEPGEQCDDANADDADACGVSCAYPVGHACVNAAQCQSHLCDGGTCTACAENGQCGSGLRCAEGRCLFGSVQCGDGVVQAGESCDDANFLEQDQCTTACLLSTGQACMHASQCQSAVCSGGECSPCQSDDECSSGTRCAIGMCLTDAQMSLLPNICGNGFRESGEACDDGNARYGDGCTPTCSVGNGPLRTEVAGSVTVQLPFGTDQSAHPGADNLANSGPATVAVMAAGAAAGTAWVRRRLKAKRS